MQTNHFFTLAQLAEIPTSLRPDQIFWRRPCVQLRFFCTATFPTYVAAG